MKLKEQKNLRENLFIIANWRNKEVNINKYFLLFQIFNKKDTVLFSFSLSLFQNMRIE